MKHTVRGILLVIPLAVSGCNALLPPSQLEPPAKVLLAPPKPIEALEPKPGDDLIQKHIEFKRAYIAETDKYRRLQRWVRTVLKK
jgi:hypothetical protein